MIFLIMLLFLAIAVSLVWFLLSNDHGPKEPVLALWTAFFIGIGGSALAYFIELKTHNNAQVGMSVSQLLLPTLEIGIIEECCKFIPLALVIYRFRFFNEHTDGIIYFAIAGLGFGLIENFEYTLKLGDKVGLDRIFLTSLFHAAITAMVGYQLAKIKVERKPLRNIIPALLLAIAIHWWYDLGLFSDKNDLTVLSIFITFGLSVNLFMMYLRATILDEKMSLSRIGVNNYCRQCGRANPRHNLYCIYCGKSA